MAGDQTSAAKACKKWKAQHHEHHQTDYDLASWLPASPVLCSPSRLHVHGLPVRWKAHSAHAARDMATVGWKEFERVKRGKEPEA
jgi:hypothetical protein